MMRDYGVYDYGLIIPDKILEDVANKRTLEEHVENEPYEIEDIADDYLSTIGNFSGNAFRIDENGKYEWDDDTIEYDDDTVYYISLANVPSFFKAVYKDMDEIVAELKQDPVSKYLPDNFDYSDHLYFITGSCWG